MMLGVPRHPFLIRGHDSDLGHTDVARRRAVRIQNDSNELLRMMLRVPRHPFLIRRYDTDFGHTDVACRHASVDAGGLDELLQ